MGKEKIVEAYDKIKTSEEMDEKFIAELREMQREKRVKNNFFPRMSAGQAVSAGKIGHFRRRRLYQRIAVAAASIAIVAAVFQIPSVNVGAREFFKYLFYTHSWEGGSVTMEIDEIAISDDAPREFKKMYNFQEVEKCLGVKFLSSSIKYNSPMKYQVRYTPYVSDEDGRLLGVIVNCDCYAWMGTEGGMVIVKTYPGETDSNDVSYFPEEDVNSPIGMEVVMVKDKKKAFMEYPDFLGLGNSNYNDEGWGGHGPKKTQKYHIQSIDADTAISELGNEWRGSADWLPTNQIEDSLPLLNAVFTYDGMQYRCYGNVSMDKMKEFLETLS